MNLQTLKDFLKNRVRFSIPRLLVRLDFLTNIVYLYFYIKLLPETTAQVTFYSIQLIFVVGATILNYARFAETYYLPLLKEMPENIYWSFILLFLFLLRIPFIRSFLPSTENKIARYFHLFFAIVVIWQVIISFQSKFWAKESINNQDKRIKSILKKAKISKREYAILRPFLIQSANLEENTPFLWKTLMFLLSLIVSAFISDAAGDFLNYLAIHFSLLFSNLFPPY